MRLRIRVPVLVSLAGALLVGTALPAVSAAAAVGVKPTVRAYVQPVGPTGNPAPGWAVTRERGQAAFCDGDSASRVAVSPDIRTCYPTALYVPACWKSSGHTVLCVRDPRKKTLVRLPLSGAFDPVAVIPKAERAPILFQLDDGDVCSIRIGGAWAALPGHPDLYGTASCVKDGATWATVDAKHNGINESSSSWTVRTAQFTSHTLTTHHVRKAWFVGMYGAMLVN